MPCDYEDDYVSSWEDEVQLAEMGVSPEEIADLQARATLARETAKLASYNAGDSLTTQQEKVKAAIEEAVKEWHLEQHARLEEVMKTINAIAHAHAPIEVT